MPTDGDVREWPIGDLLAAVVGTAEPRSDLVEQAGGLERLAVADPFEIAAWVERRDLDAPDRRAPVGKRPRAIVKARALSAAFELGRRLEMERAGTRSRFASAEEIAAWATPRLASLAHEELWMLALDGRGHLRGARCVARGGLHGASLRAADPIRAALRADASAFVLVHNHPSGDPTPSKEDVALTAAVAAASAVVGVLLLDHVVVARSGFACVSPGAER